MSTATQPLHEDTGRPPADQSRSDLHRGGEQVRAFQVHGAVFGAGILAIFLVNLLTNLAAGIADQWWAWWSAWALIGWALGVGVHGLVVWQAQPPHAVDGSR